MMAKITLHPMVSELTGAAGTAVFARSQGIQYLKQKTRPGGEPSERQIAVREALARLPMLRKWMSDSVIAAQLTAGEEGNMSGYAWWTQMNASLERTQETSIFTPPNEAIGRTMITGVDNKVGVTDVFLNYTDGPIDDMYWIYWLRRISPMPAQEIFLRYGWGSEPVTDFKVTVGTDGPGDYIVVAMAENKITEAVGESYAYRYTRP